MAAMSTTSETTGFSDRADAYARRVERTLDDWLPDAGVQPRKLHRALRYAALDGGKRIRPLLCFAAAEAVGRPAEEVDAMAAAVELVHCYSLIHDDLPAMDDDDLRRGKPTVHRAFDEATAILAGDALLTLAFEGLAADGVDVEAIGVLASAAGSRGMVGGQALDLSFESSSPDRDALEAMFARKTGALIRAAVQIGILFLLCSVEDNADVHHDVDKQAFISHERAQVLPFFFETHGERGTRFHDDLIDFPFVCQIVPAFPG